MTTKKDTKANEFNKDAFIAAAGSKSAAIRKLLAEGKTRGEVSKLLGIRYQHVRNVEITPIKKESRRVYQDAKRKLTDAELDAEMRAL